MRFIHSALVCVAAALLGGCGGSGGIAGKSSDLPPDEFLEAHWSYGDLDDTSTCYRTQQLVFVLTGAKDGWKWTKLDESTWEYVVPIEGQHGEKGTARLRLTKPTDKVRAVEYEEIVDGKQSLHIVGPEQALNATFINTLRQNGVHLIQGCPDPSYLTKRYKTVG
jgi:hypothetical protein